MKRMSVHELREHVFKIKVRSNGDNDRMLAYFLNYCYPNKRTQNS